ncbi:MAG: pilin [bacterium]|nr:pilin [bacterium]
MKIVKILLPDMKQLFFASIFFFGAFFFLSPYALGETNAESAVTGGTDTPCVGDNKVGFSGTCQTFEVCGGDPNNFDSSEEDCSPGFLCCNSSGSSEATTGGGGDSTGLTCVSSIDGSTGKCRTRANCGGGALGNADICTDGLGCCVGGSSGGPIGGGGGVTITCNGIIRAGVCFPVGTGLSDTPVWFLLMRLMWWLLAIFGMIAIIAFVVSGVQYLISAGNEAMIETAKRNMLYSMLGVLVGLSGWVIIRAIDSALNGFGFLWF